MNALETWVAEHPFLDGGTGTSSAVFEAMISAYALLSTESSEVALKKEINRGTAANPFLHTFYMDEISQSASGELKGSHIGVIYASLRASLSIGETASLYIEGYEEADDSLEPAEGEFVISRHSEGKTR